MERVTMLQLVSLLSKRLEEMSEASATVYSHLGVAGTIETGWDDLLWIPVSREELPNVLNVRFLDNLVDIYFEEQGGWAAKVAQRVADVLR